MKTKTHKTIAIPKFKLIYSLFDLKIIKILQKSKGVSKIEARGVTPHTQHTYLEKSM